MYNGSRGSIGIITLTSLPKFRQKTAWALKPISKELQTRSHAIPRFRHHPTLPNAPDGTASVKTACDNDIATYVLIPRPKSGVYVMLV